MKSGSRPLFLTAVLCVVYGLVLTLTNFLSGTMYVDEYHFFPTTLQFANEPLPSLHLLYSYGELNTPLPFMLGGLLINIFGQHIEPLRIFTFALSFLTLLGFIWGAPSSWKAPFAVAAVLLFPNFYFCSVYFYTDMYALAGIMAGCIAYLKGRHGLGFLGFALAICSRQYSVAFPFTIVVAEILQSLDRQKNIWGNIRSLMRRPVWLWYAGAVLTLLPWLILWKGGAPPAEMARQYYHLGKSYNPGFAMYAAACLAVYGVIPEMMITRSWRYYLDYPVRHFRLFVGFVVLSVVIALLLPAEQTVNPYVYVYNLGFFDRLVEMAGLGGVLKQLLFGALMTLTLMRFVRPKLNLLDGLMLCNLLLLGKTQLAWDKYLMPVTTVFWFMAQFDAYFPMKSYLPIRKKEAKEVEVV